MRLSETTQEFIDAVDRMARLAEEHQLTEEEFVDTLSVYKDALKNKICAVYLKLQEMEDRRDEIAKDILKLQKVLNSKTTTIDNIKFYIVRYLTAAIDEATKALEEIKLKVSPNTKLETDTPKQGIGIEILVTDNEEQTKQKIKDAHQEFIDLNTTNPIGEQPC